MIEDLRGGVVGATLYASLQDFQAYAGGVFDGCTPSDTHINHAVVVVGYGTDAATGIPYWKVRNSWSAGWGNGGYILMKRGPDVWPEGMCGIMQYTYFPQLTHPVPPGPPPSLPQPPHPPGPPTSPSPPPHPSLRPPPPHSSPPPSKNCAPSAAVVPFRPASTPLSAAFVAFLVLGVLTCLYDLSVVLAHDRVKSEPVKRALRTAAYAASAAAVVAWVALIALYFSASDADAQRAVRLTLNPLDLPPVVNAIFSLAGAVVFGVALDAALMGGDWWNLPWRRASAACAFAAAVVAFFFLIILLGYYFGCKIFSAQPVQGGTPTSLGVAFIVVLVLAACVAAVDVYAFVTSKKKRSAAAVASYAVAAASFVAVVVLVSVYEATPAALARPGVPPLAVCLFAVTGAVTLAVLVDSSILLFASPEKWWVPIKAGASVSRRRRVVLSVAMLLTATTVLFAFLLVGFYYGSVVFHAPRLSEGC